MSSQHSLLYFRHGLGGGGVIFSLTNCGTARTVHYSTYLFEILEANKTGRHRMPPKRWFYRESDLHPIEFLLCTYGDLYEEDRLPFLL